MLRSSASLRPVGDLILRALPGLVLAASGILMSVVAGGQPAWLETNVGPGLMAQLLGKGVIAIGVAWAFLCVARQAPMTTTGCGSGPSLAANWWSGPALLGAVLVFALGVPSLGLVISAGLAAALAAIGAGERKPVALLVTVLGLIALTAGIGLAFLPPTAPLWPSS